MGIWYLAWGLLLATQHAAFTWSSRARNSGSLVYHAIAVTVANSIWFVSQFILVDQFVKLRDAGSTYDLVFLGLVYVGCTVSGSVAAHHLLQRYVESGSRKMSV